MKTPNTELFRKYLESVTHGGNVVAFKEAGDELVDFVVRGEKYSWYEPFLRPIGFLYRHYLELELKYWIKELDEGALDQAGSVLQQHNLRKLWLALEPLIQPFSRTKEDHETLSEVEDVILTFDEYDRSGQEFRYTRTTKDIGTLRNIPPRIDLKEIKCLVARVSFFFDGLGGVVSV